MHDPDATCWTLVRNAADGDKIAREEFGRVYLPVVMAYLVVRWNGLSLDADDAAQDVFVECFKSGGALERVDADRPSGFRAFLLGVVRNVARRYECRRQPPESLPDDLASEESGSDNAFDRAWARALLRQAAQVQELRAADTGEPARRRVELLKLRFQDGRPIREIARLWGVDSAVLHHEYATAREEFRAALRQVVAFHHPSANSAELESLCKELVVQVA